MAQGGPYAIELRCRVRWPVGWGEGVSAITPDLHRSGPGPAASPVRPPSGSQEFGRGLEAADSTPYPGGKGSQRFVALVSAEMVEDDIALCNAASRRPRRSRRALLAVSCAN